MTKKKKIIIFSAIGALVLLGGGCTAATVFSAIPKGAVGAETVAAEKQDLSRSISVSGNVKGSNIVKVTSNVTSQISQILVAPGDIVEEGQVLCIFDSSMLEEEYKRLEESLSLSDEMTERTHKLNLRNLEDAKKERDNSLALAQRSIDDAEKAKTKAYAKYDKLVEACAEAEAECDELYELYVSADEDEAASYSKLYQSALAEYRSVEAEKEAFGEQLESYDAAVQNAKDAYESTKRGADAAVQAAQDVIDSEKYSVDNSGKEQLRKLKEQIDQCTVKAPASGMITSVNAAEGSIPTTDAIMTIEDADTLKISVNIREADILKVNEGQRATVKTAATGDKKFDGKVTKVVKIYQAGDIYLGTEGGYIAEITIEGDHENLFIGMNASVQIILEEKENVLAVPYDSIVEKENGDHVVYISEPSGDGFIAREAKVEPGMESDYFTEITSSDVKEGDKVIITPIYMEDGASFATEIGGFDE